MSQNRNRSLLSTQSWRNMSQSLATALCNVSGAAYSRLHLDAITRRVLPEHTREAFFQLFCDVRTNTPKDQVFFMRHAEALKPHTFTGWLAMLSALLYSTAGLALFSVSALGLMATVAFGSIFFAVIAGITIATFVGTVATTLSFASLGLVAVAGGAGTTAAAGYLTLSFWRTVFQQLGVVRSQPQLTSSPSGRQSLPTSSQHVFTGPDLQSKSQSTGASAASASGNRHTGTSQSRAPMQGLSETAPGETTGQATHNRLTTEPAKDPLNKDINIGGQEVSDIFSKAGSSPRSTATTATGGSEGVESAFGSVLSQDSSVREFLDGTFAVKSGKGHEDTPSAGDHTSRITGQSTSASNQAGSPFMTGTAPDQTSDAFKIGSASDQAGGPFKTGGAIGNASDRGRSATAQNSSANDQTGSPFNTGSASDHAHSATAQKSGASDQVGSAFKTGSASDSAGGSFKPGSASDQADSPFKSGGLGSGSSTVTTGAPAFTQKQATNTTDINQIYDKGGQGHTAPNTVQTGQPRSSPQGNPQGSQGTHQPHDRSSRPQGLPQGSPQGPQGTHQSHDSSSSRPQGPQAARTVHEMNKQGGSQGGPSTGQTSASASSESTGTAFGQATNDADINDVSGNFGTDTAQSQARPSSGSLPSSQFQSSLSPNSSHGGSLLSSQDQSSAISNSSRAGDRGSNDTVKKSEFSTAQGQARPSSGSSAFGSAPGSAPGAQSASYGTPGTQARNRPTNDSDINDVFGKGASHQAHNPFQGSSGGHHGSSGGQFGQAFAGFGQPVEDIGLQSNFMGPSGQQGPYGSSGPRGSSRHY